MGSTAHLDVHRGNEDDDDIDADPHARSPQGQGKNKGNGGYQQLRSQDIVAALESYSQSNTPGLRKTTMKPRYGTEKFNFRRSWRAVLMEYIATTLFVFFACASVVAGTNYSVPTAAPNILAAITQGFAIATFVYAIAHTSGGHINPAVTLSFIVSGHIGLVRGILYILAQLIGGITGAAILSGVLPGRVEGTLGSTTPSNGISAAQAYVFEFILTFTLLFTIYGTAIHRGSYTPQQALSPIPIGFAVVIGVGIAFNFTGGSLNPARSFGPAVISDTWTIHYVYWFGPFTASIVVGLLERYVFLVEPEKVDSDTPQMENEKGEPVDDNGNPASAGSNAPASGGGGGGRSPPPNSANQREMLPMQPRVDPYNANTVPPAGVLTASGHIRSAANLAGSPLVPSPGLRFRGGTSQELTRMGAPMP